MIQMIQMIKSLTTQFTADKGQIYVRKAFGCPLIYLFYFNKHCEVLVSCSGQKIRKD